MQSNDNDADSPHLIKLHFYDIIEAELFGKVLRIFEENMKALSKLSTKTSNVSSTTTI